MKESARYAKIVEWSDEGGCSIRQAAAARHIRMRLGESAARHCRNVR